MSGCQHCNPYCDNCKPAMVKYLACPECGKTNAFLKKDILADKELCCSKCGLVMTELVRPKSVLCTYVNAECAYPCRRSTETAPDGLKGFCAVITSPEAVPWLAR